MPDYPMLSRFLEQDDALNKQRRLLDTELQANSPPSPSYAGTSAALTDTASSRDKLQLIHPWSATTSSTALTERLPYIFPVYLNKGDELTEITLVSGSQGMTDPDWYAFAILNPSFYFEPEVLAITLDGGQVPADDPWYETAWYSEAPKTLRFTETFVVPASGYYPLVVCCEVVSGTTPNLISAPCPVAVWTASSPAAPFYGAGLNINAYSQMANASEYVGGTWTYFGYWAYGTITREVPNANAVA